MIVFCAPPSLLPFLLFHWQLARPTPELASRPGLPVVLLLVLSWAVRLAQQSVEWRVRRLVES
jgi:hypothetical protein